MSKLADALQNLTNLLAGEAPSGESSDDDLPGPPIPHRGTQAPDAAPAASSARREAAAPEE